MSKDELLKQAKAMVPELLAFRAKYGPGLRPNDVAWRACNIIEELIKVLEEPVSAK